MARANQKVCFIGGAGHSGSTLTGLVLGAHPQVFYAGEARKSLFLGDPSKPLRKRTCKVCGEGCKVWSAIDRSDDLYEALSRKTLRPIVVDSTKQIDWIDQQTSWLGARGVEMQLVFLGRDGRAVVNSRVRKDPDTSVRDHALAWVRQIEATEALAARFPGKVTRIRYEALATDPQSTIATLAGALGIEPTPSMLDPWSTEQHPLGGNAGTQSLLAGARTGIDGAMPVSGKKRDYYGAHGKVFKLDLRWKHELVALAEFESVAHACNRDYAWDG